MHIGGWPHRSIDRQSAESVRLGHPDKVADWISDAVLDAYLAKDPESHVAVETLISNHTVIIAGEISSTADVDHEGVVHRVLEEAHYGPPDIWAVRGTVQPQSRDIEQGVKGRGGQLGAGDQGIVYGHATTGTGSYMPKATQIAREITRELDAHMEKWSWLRPDGKALVTTNGMNADVVVSTSHAKDQSLDNLREDIHHGILQPILDSHGLVARSIDINPGGSFTQFGPTADTGLTGRKVIVDSYGGLVPHGGGAWSGKDPTKIDRSAAYFARYVARNLLEDHRLSEATICLTYAFGKPWPVNIEADLRSSGMWAYKKQLPYNALTKYDFSVQNIIDELDLRRPIYEEALKKGHVGDPTLPWEQPRTQDE